MCFLGSFAGGAPAKSQPQLELCHGGAILYTCVKACLMQFMDFSFSSCICNETSIFIRIICFLMLTVELCNKNLLSSCVLSSNRSSGTKSILQDRLTCTSCN